MVVKDKRFAAYIARTRAAPHTGAIVMSASVDTRGLDDFSTDALKEWVRICGGADLLYAALTKGD